MLNFHEVMFAPVEPQAALSLNDFPGLIGSARFTRTLVNVTQRVRCTDVLQ